ncbi:ankyrin repeat domain-containing protein [Nitratifractor salsuginis]|uniref:Ankyrin n=1 Tax=Nitratifractor salsuginis (strain DSM 16511 / JCM 12458 / E9I37-1) TaxID=749222 RepID=E6WYN9_NITSE|nr:ankyrin repeat domain-containing protein [Nitratifractor salsuginis]ADV45410.1 Ankyrin [Nitratifractor salsuginis DSM 16511]
MSPSGKTRQLLEAIERDNLVEIRKLLASGEIDLNGEVTIGEEYGLDDPDEIPLLFYVIMRGISPEALDLLLDAGLDLNFTNREGLGAIDIAIKYRRHDIVRRCKEAGISLSESRRKSGMTPLMLAAAFNDVEMVRYLMEEGAEINAVDKYGMTALDYARKMGQGKVKEFLESVGAVHQLYDD